MKPDETRKIPLVIYFTESHKRLYDEYFLPAFQRHLAADFYLIEGSSEQRCETGVFGSEGWTATMKSKLSYVRRAMDTLEHEPLLVYSDVDVIFTVSPKSAFLEELGEHEIAMQDDRDTLCAGLFIIRNTAQVRELLDAAIADCHDDDQQALNRGIKRLSIPVRVLSEDFYSVWRANGTKIWGGHRVKWPEKRPVAFHANFVVGVHRKYLLLDYFIAHYEGTLLTKSIGRIRNFVALLRWSVEWRLQRLRGR